MFYIREQDKKIIFQCKTDKLKNQDIEAVKEIVTNNPEKQIILNFSGVSQIKTTALKLLKEISEQNKVSLCSLDSDIFAAINLLNYDKFFNIYPDEGCSITKKAELINRRFKIV